MYTQLKTKYEPSESCADDKSQESFFWDPPTKSGNSSSDVETKESLHNLLKYFYLIFYVFVCYVFILLRVLYEKIVLLEQKNREQDIILTNMSQQISVQNTKFAELPLRYCNGTFLWTVKEFHSKLENMYSEPKKMFYSPAFFTSPNGYK